MIVLYQIALAVTALGAFLISTAIWLRKAKDRTKFDTIFGFMAVSLIAWAVGRYGIFVAQDKDTANFWVYIIYNGSILVHVFFLHTILVFLEVEKKYRLILASFYALAAILLSLNNFDFVTSSQLFTKGVEAKLNFRFYEVPGPLHFLHLINYTFIPLFSFVLMLLHIKKFSGEKLQQLKFIIFSSILGLLGGNSVVPLVFGIPIEPLFLFLVPFHLLTLIYAITRHHLFNIKVIATEIFTFTLLILMLTRTFLADNLQDRLIDSGLFGATLILGIFLVRSVVQETKIREKVEKLAKQLQNVNEKLQQVDKVKTEFISIASHQLRTPLTIIKGYTSMALEGTFGRYTKQQHDVMDKLFQSANRLINLVEDLLNISRLEQGRIEYEYKVIDPVALVRGVVEELEQKAKNKGLRLIFIKPKHSVPHIRATSLIPIGIGGSGETFCFSL